MELQVEIQNSSLPNYAALCKLSYHIMLAVFFSLEFVTQLLDYYSTIQLRQEFPSPTPSAPAGHGALAPLGGGRCESNLAICVESVYTSSTTKQ